ncbi:hypothetical protein BU17DRAFT_64930 [Hysterangium stoloniferum]|nr:hypothetical protein BU17DRAFT_64930 [Hysterangium stoloniferum]
MFIRVWDSIGSMVDLFAIVGQIEKHFGRVLDFTAPRDSDVKGTFCADVAAIPREGKVIQVPDPEVDATLLGGVFIRDTLRSTSMRAAKQEIPPFPKEVKVIDVKIGTQMSQQGGAERVLAGTLKTSNILSSSSHVSPESSHMDASTSEPLTTSTPIHTHARESTPASQPPPSDTPLSTAPHENAGTSTPRQRPKPALAPKQPTLSKRERMLLAVRQAGAAEVSSRKERGERDSTDVWRDYDGADDREHREVGMKGSGAEGSRVAEPLPKGYGDLWEFSRPENTRNAESEGSEGEKQPPQETETMEEATSWWRKMTRFRKCAPKTFPIPIYFKVVTNAILLLEYLLTGRRLFRKRLHNIPYVTAIIFNSADIKTCYACALVCKAWLEPALDELWRVIEQPVALFRLLGPMHLTRWMAFHICPPGICDLIHAFRVVTVNWN